jgi:hypothetical protein
LDLVATAFDRSRLARARDRAAHAGSGRTRRPRHASGGCALATRRAARPLRSPSGSQPRRHGGQRLRRPRRAGFHEDGDLALRSPALANSGRAGGRRRRDGGFFRSYRRRRAPSRQRIASRPSCGCTKVARDNWRR